MCSGKTTLARALAAYTGRRFVDLDELVELRAGMSVGRIFDTLGEERFRQLEREALLSTASLENAVIACGGGTPCGQGNMAWINDNGLTVLLEANRGRLMSRLIEGAAKRPLIAQMSPDEIESFIDEAIESRRKFYELAHHRFDSSFLENEEEIAATVQKFINKYMSND